MTTVIVGMLVALLISAAVVAAVAIPAHRQGREVLTAEGEQRVQAALERTADVVVSAREKVSELAERLPTPSADPSRPGADGEPDVDLRESGARGERSAARQQAGN